MIKNGCIEKGSNLLEMEQVANIKYWCESELSHSRHCVHPTVSYNLPLKNNMKHNHELAPYIFFPNNKIIVISFSPDI